jgi:hypothetical protein
MFMIFAIVEHADREADASPAELMNRMGHSETADLDQIRFVEGHIEDPPLAAGSCDTVISHGVINLSAAKAAVRARQPISTPLGHGFDQRAELRQRTV